MTTKKELRTRVDLHTAEITQLYQQLDNTQAAVNKLRETIDTQNQNLAALFDNIQAAVAKIRELSGAAAEREQSRQSQIDSATSEVTSRIDIIANLFTKQSDINSAEFSALRDKIASLEHAADIHDKQNQYTINELRTLEQTITNKIRAEKLKKLSAEGFCIDPVDFELLKGARDTANQIPQIIDRLKKLERKQRDQTNGKQTRRKPTRKPAPKQTTTSPTSPTPTKTKLRPNTRTEQPAAKRRGRRTRRHPA